MIEETMSRRDRIAAAIGLEPVDRVPVIAVTETVAPRFAGVTLAQTVRDPVLAREVHMRVFDMLGGWDAAYGQGQMITELGMTSLACPMKLPGYQLGDDELWQVDERQLVTADGYAFIAENGWDAFVEKVYPALGYPVPPEHLAERLRQLAQQEIEGINLWNAKGVPVFTAIGPAPGFECLSYPRTLQQLLLDVFRQPDQVLAAIETIETEQVAQSIERFRLLAEATDEGPVAVFVGGGRGAFLSPKNFDKFYWPFLKSAVERLVDAGITPSLHLDSNHTPYLEHLLDLPAKKVVLELDGATDIFRAKEILRGHMCIMGDVHPGLLALGTPQEVTDYCTRLIDEIGEDGGFILKSGCVIPMNARFENVRAMIDTAKSHFPH